jgi:hypothetical protein
VSASGPSLDRDPLLLFRFFPASVVGNRMREKAKKRNLDKYREYKHRLDKGRKRKSVLPGTVHSLTCAGQNY